MDNFINITRNTSYNSYNNVVDLGYFLTCIKNISITVNITISIGILACNLILLITILTSATFRKELRYMLVVSLALGDLLLGLAGVPVITDFGLQKRITVSCEFHVVLQVLVIYAHVMITSIGLLIINIDYVIKQYRIRFVNLSPSRQISVNVFLAVFPWLLMIIVATPLIAVGIHEQTIYIWGTNRCPLLLYRWALLTLLFVCFYVPGIFITLATGIIIKGWLATRRGTAPFRPTLLNADRALIHPKYIVIINLVSVLLLLPSHVISDHLHVNDIRLLITVSMICFQLSMLKAVIFPALWLCVPEIRELFLKKVKTCWRKAANDLPQHVVNKSYREFASEDEQQED